MLGIWRESSALCAFSTIHYISVPLKKMIEISEKILNFEFKKFFFLCFSIADYVTLYGAISFV